MTADLPQPDKNPLTTINPYLELDELAKNFAEHLTRDELLLYIIALVEERGEEGFAYDLILELQDIILTDTAMGGTAEEEDLGFT